MREGLGHVKADFGEIRAELAHPHQGRVLLDVVNRGDGSGDHLLIEIFRPNYERDSISVPLDLVRAAMARRGKL